MQGILCAGVGAHINFLFDICVPSFLISVSNFKKYFTNQKYFPATKITQKWNNWSSMGFFLLLLYAWVLVYGTAWSSCIVRCVDVVMRKRQIDSSPQYNIECLRMSGLCISQSSCASVYSFCSNVNVWSLFCAYICARQRQRYRRQKKFYFSLPWAKSTDTFSYDYQVRSVIAVAYGSRCALNESNFNWISYYFLQNSVERN